MQNGRLQIESLVQSDVKVATGIISESFTILIIQDEILYPAWNRNTQFSYSSKFVFQRYFSSTFKLIVDLAVYKIEQWKRMTENQTKQNGAKPIKTDQTKE